MNWDELRNGMYHIDGSWRDIYVLNTTKEDWHRWIEYVNTNYEVSWYADDYNSGIAVDTIDSQFINCRWDSKHCATTVSVLLGKVQINCHFFTESQIENDIDPREIKSLDDHKRVMEYMKSVYNLLGKEVILTEENSEDAIWIKVNGNDIDFPSECD